MSYDSDNRGLRTLVDAGEEVMQTQREQIAVLTAQRDQLLAKLRVIKAVGLYCDNDADAAQAMVVIVSIASSKEVSQAEAKPDAVTRAGRCVQGGCRARVAEDFLHAALLSGDIERPYGFVAEWLSTVAEGHNTEGIIRLSNVLAAADKKENPDIF